MSTGVADGTPAPRVSVSAGSHRRTAASPAAGEVPRLMVVVLLDGAGSLADLPPFSLARVFTAWSLDPLLTVLSVWVAGLYLVGVRTLHRRGGSPPGMRAVGVGGGGGGGVFFAPPSRPGPPRTPPRPVPP